MGEYVMNSRIIAIPMCGDGVILGFQWLQSLGTMDFNFQDLFMKFSLEGNEIELRGIKEKPSKVISSNGMIKLLKKGHQGVIVQLCSLNFQTFKPYIPLDLQGIIDNHSKLFEDIPRGIPPTRNHDHAIHLILGSVPPNIRVYRYPLLRLILASKISLPFSIFQTSFVHFFSLFYTYPNSPFLFSLLFSLSSYYTW
jgi:hypothetical protein